MASQTKSGPALYTGAASTAAPVPAGSAPAGTRLWFVDHLRLVLVCGVVVAHVASLYAGGWYQYHDPIQADVLTTIGLGIPSIIADSFGLGFFFLIAGYFTPGSYDRKGGASFLRDRLVRLGIPLLLYDLLVDPLVVYVARGRHGSYWSFYGSYLLQVRTIGPVVAWFITTLLLFTLLYAAWRALTRKRSHAAQRPATLPGTRDPGVHRCAGPGELCGAPLVAARLVVDASLVVASAQPSRRVPSPVSQSLCLGVHSLST